jgi:hypothetical protein
MTIQEIKTKKKARGSVLEQEDASLQKSWEENSPAGDRIDEDGNKSAGHATPRQVQNHKSRDTARGSYSSGLYIYRGGWRETELARKKIDFFSLV